MGRLRHFLTTALCLFLGVSAAFAQTTGSVRGVGKDSSGAIILGVNATLTNKGTNAPTVTLTNETGTYSFGAVLPGTYSLTFDLQGFRRGVRDNLTVNIADVIVIDPVLQVGEINQSVEVTSQAALVQASNVELGRVVEQMMVTGVPLSARNFTQILGLSPGVSSDTLRFSDRGPSLADNFERPPRSLRSWSGGFRAGCESLRHPGSA